MATGDRLFTSDQNSIIDCRLHVRAVLLWLKKKTMRRKEGKGLIISLEKEEEEEEEEEEAYSITVERTVSDITNSHRIFTPGSEFDSQPACTD